MLRKIVIMLALVVLVAACQSTPSNRSALEKQSRLLTHKLVNAEATLTDTIDGLLPKGIVRMNAIELEQTYISVNNKKVMASEYLKVKNLQELENLLSVPARVDNTSKQYLVFSYDGSNYSYIVFVFSKSQQLQKVVGYKNSNPW